MPENTTKQQAELVSAKAESPQLKGYLSAAEGAAGGLEQAMEPAEKLGGATTVARQEGDQMRSRVEGLEEAAQNLQVLLACEREEGEKPRRQLEDQMLEMVGDGRDPGKGAGGG